MRSGLSLANRMCEEWFRQGLAWYYQFRGQIVLFDRHYFSDYYAYDIAAGNGGRPLGRRIHGFMLKYLYPKPNLIIYLDAPAELLFARKGEGTLKALEHRRPLKAGAGVERAYAMVRKYAAPLLQDRALSSDISALAAAIRAGEFDSEYEKL